MARKLRTITGDLRLQEGPKEYRRALRAYRQTLRRMRRSGEAWRLWGMGVNPDDPLESIATMPPPDHPENQGGA